MRSILSIFVVCFLIGIKPLKAQLTSNPSPIVASSSATLIYTSAAAGPFYVYSWAKAGTTDKPAVDWNSNIVDAYKMTKESNGTFTFNIASLKDFYHLTDAELTTVTQIGVLIRKADGSKETPNDLFLTVTQAPPPPPYSGGGDGTIGNPYILMTTADLDKLSKTSAHWSLAFKVGAAINATAVTASIGNASTPFSGVFDGDNKEITGSIISGTNELGFFGVINGATITKVALRNISITASGNYAGAFAGKIKGTSNISNCSVLGTVTAEGGCIGGFVGTLENGNLSANFVKVDVTSNYGSCIGGFVGLSTGATSLISDCYATGNVTGTSSTAVGGFAGKLEKTAAINASYATGNVGSNNDYVGGFVGANYGQIQNSFATTKTISSTKKYVAQFGGNNNSENIVTNNIAWNGAALASGSFSGFGDASTLKPASSFTSQDTFNGVGGLGFTFSGTKWSWSTSSYPALSIATGQSYPYPFDVNTSLFKVSAKAEVNVYPTLVTSTVKVIGKNISSAHIIDLVGNTVCSFDNLNPEQTENELDLSQLEGGIYLIRIIDGNNATKTVKLIKK